MAVASARTSRCNIFISTDDQIDEESIVRKCLGRHSDSGEEKAAYRAASCCSPCTTAVNVMFRQWCCQILLNARAAAVATACVSFTVGQVRGGGVTSVGMEPRDPSFLLVEASSRCMGAFHAASGTSAIALSRLLGG